MKGFNVILSICALFFGTPVTGISFKSTPGGFVIGSTGTLTLTCSVTESSVYEVYNIKINRTIAPGSTTYELMASFVSGTATLDKNINDDKGYTVSGSKTGNAPSLEISMDISKLTCNDARLYRCDVGYDIGSIETAIQNLTLQAFVLPQMMPPLQARRNGNFIEGGTLTDKAVFDVGDQLELECRANIGSLESTRIRWGKTSEMQDSDFIGYQPQEGTYDEGTPLNDNQCGYTRTAIIRYNVTAPVVGYDLGFECYVSVSGYPSSSLTQSGQYTTDNRLRYYIDVTSSTTQSPGAASAGSGNAGAIAGGVVGGLVLIVLIVLLVYFLWYRRRSSGDDCGGNVGAIVGGVIGGLLGIIIIVVVVWFLWFRRRDGETYATKEEYGSENPNMAPPVDTYATVDKKKRGHENKGLDEPHERRRHHYENGPGRSNYGMDRDADDYDSRDGSPTMTHQGISHMGMDPVDGRIGTGV